MLWEVLIQFIFRLSMGLAVTMALTSPREVNSGFFRVHLWVLLGLGTFGSLVAYSRQSLFDQPMILLGLALSVTVLSYLGSVVWLYEKLTAGRWLLVLISGLMLVLLMLAHPSKNAVGMQWGWIE